MFARAWVAVLLASSGCSMAFIDRPPRAVRRTDMVPPPGCTASQTMPFLDVALAVVGVVGGIGIVAGKIDKTENKDQPDEMKVPLTSGEKLVYGSTAIVEGILFAVSGLYGFEQTKACRSLRANLQPLQPLPQQYPPAPMYPPPTPQPQPYPQPQPQSQPYPQPQPQPQPGATP